MPPKALRTASTAPGYAVKALEWDNNSMPSADCIFGRYMAWEINGEGYWAFQRLPGFLAKGGLAAAKAAAQADYEQRIRSALVERPATSS